MRRRLKAEIQSSNKGGKKGQWSARKSQLLVHEYEKHGGSYLGEKDEAAKSLEAWTDQNWQTQEGSSAKARQDDGSTNRYLPEKAWGLLSDAEKQEAERKKRQGSRKGQQYVENTLAAKEARKTTVGEEPSTTKQQLYKQAQKLGIKGRSAMSKLDLEQAVARAES